MTPQREDGFTLVELMVVMTIMGVIASAITGVVISQLRLEQDQQAMQDTIDDGRRAIEQMRRELRQARRIYADDPPEGSTGHPDRLRFWLDEDQDGQQEPAESLCYVVEELDGGDGSQWELMRRTHATHASHCEPGGTTPGQERLLARTLVDPEPFLDYAPAVSSDPNDPPTRRVEVLLALEVVSQDGPSAVDVDATIRLRNVP